MNDKESGAQRRSFSLGDLLRLPKHHVRVDISVESPAYQAYLLSERAIELAREDLGDVPAKLYEQRRLAAVAVDQEAKKRIVGDNSNP